MKPITWYATTKDNHWQRQEYRPVSGEASSSVTADGRTDQSFIGFGGCFNEMGGIALKKLSQEDQDAVMDLLFDPEADGLRLTFNRMSMGASDYGARWYSYNETPGDYAMEHFSIDEDRPYMLPYIKEAYKRNPNMQMFGSPWSPPTWMKFPAVYNFGHLIWTEENLKAYALYFAKYVQAYAAEGIKINQVHIQNEPFSDQKFPSCVWKNGDEFRIFISKYIGPLFEELGLDTDIMLGTLNRDETCYNDYPNRTFHDKEVSKYCKGVGFQWAGKHCIPQVHESFPDKLLIQTENECGNGQNDWGYANYIFGLFRHYLTHGVSAYVYWNMILEQGGMSSWGWHQNSMVVVDNGRYTLTPEYYVMKHFSRYIQKDAVRLCLTGHWTGTSVAFRNPDGSVVLVTQNGFPEAQTVEFTVDGETYTFELAPESINTMVL